MSEYEKQAQDFCDKWGVDIQAKYLGLAFPAWEDVSNPSSLPHPSYYVIMKREGREHRFIFYNSLASICGDRLRKPHMTVFDVIGLNKFPSNIKRPTKYDILACLIKYEPASYVDFCKEYGYEDTRKTLDIYISAQDEYHNVRWVLGAEPFPDFKEIC